MRRHILAACIALTAGSVMADEFVLFKASEAGDEAWTWGQARIKAREGGILRVTENSPTNDAGDVYVAGQFPYYPTGRVKMDVGKVSSGNYTFQLMCFKSGTYFHTAEPISHVKSTNQHDFALGSLGLPPETESVMFKIWVSGAKGASIDLNELSYSDDIDLSHAQLDDHFGDVTPWVCDTDKVAFAAVGGGGRLAVLRGAGYGSITRSDDLTRQPGQEILFKVGQVNGCTVTLQLNLFDATGAFVQAIDAISYAGRGTYGVRLDSLKWPPGVSRYGIKVWATGKDNSTAVLERLIVFTR